MRPRERWLQAESTSWSTVPRVPAGRVHRAGWDRAAARVGERGCSFTRGGRGCGGGSGTPQGHRVPHLYGLSSKTSPAHPGRQWARPRVDVPQRGHVMPAGPRGVPVTSHQEKANQNPREMSPHTRPDGGQTSDGGWTPGSPTARAGGRHPHPADSQASTASALPPGVCPRGR